MSQILPPKENVSAVVRKLQATRIRNVQKYADVQSPLKRLEATKLAAVRMLNQLRQWGVYGVANFAAGALHWRRIWHTLQCGLIWSEHVTTADPDDASDDSNDGKSRSIIAGKRKVAWKFDPTEGPEGMRTRLEQNFEGSLKTLVANKAKSSASISGVMKAPGLLLSTGALAAGSDGDTDSMAAFLKEISIIID